MLGWSGGEATWLGGGCQGPAGAQGSLWMCGGEGFCAQDPRKGGPVGSQLTGLAPRKATCREACRADGVGGPSGTGRWERAKGTKWGAVGGSRTLPRSARAPPSDGLMQKALHPAGWGEGSGASSDREPSGLARHWGTV